MKVWRYYRERPSSEVFDKTDVLEKYELYACTCRKSVAEEFEKIRDMKKLIRIAEDMEESDWVQYSKDNQGAIIAGTKFLTRDKNQRVFHVSVYATQYEADLVREAGSAFILDDVMERELFAFPYIFNNELIKALDIIGYIFRYRAYNEYNIPSDMGQIIRDERGIEFGDEMFDEAFDEVQVFIDNFMDTLNLNPKKRSE